MFRLGGSARKNYQNGTDLSEIEKLINKRAGLRDKALGSMRTMLPLSVLASQRDDIRTIRKPGDIFSDFEHKPHDKMMELMKGEDWKEKLLPKELHLE